MVSQLNSIVIIFGLVLLIHVTDSSLAAVYL